MTTTPAAGIYVRISEDRAGAGLGVERQEEDCRALCQRLGWNVVDTYADNDTSAYSGKRRPNWERLIDDVKAGEITAITCWHVDRLTRSPRELEDVIDMADAHQLRLATVTGEVDLGNPSGRMVARIMGAAARHESEHKAARQIRARRQAALAGKDNGGPRPYGYEKDRSTIREDEAAVIREVAARLLAHESLTSICQDLNERGNIPTSRGNPWQRKTLRNMMISARISGRREHNPWNGGQGKRPLTGAITADATWPAIITAEQSDRLRVLLVEQSERGTTGVGRTYLLSGLLRCQICGSGLVGRKVGGRPRYVCYKRVGVAACGGISVTAAWADEVVRDLVVTALASDDLRDRLNARLDVDPALPQTVDEDEQLLVDLGADVVARRITLGEYHNMRDPVEARLVANRRKLARATDTAAIQQMTGDRDELLTLWAAANTSQRRAIVAAVLDRVTVSPSRFRKFDVDRFAPVWRA